MRKQKKAFAATLILLVNIALFSLSPFLPVVYAESASPVYEWTQYLETVAGIGPDITEITTAPDGSVYAVGDLYGTVDFDPTGAGDVFTETGGSDTFITKRGSDGSYQWTRVIGDPAGSQSTGYFPQTFTKVDAAGNIYLYGDFRTTVNFNPTGSDVRTALSNSDSFATKWNADGTYGWTHTFGAPVAPNGEAITAIEVSASGDVYLAGDFTNLTDFNAYGAGDVKSTVGGGTDRDAYITKINANGSYGWTQTFGSTGTDYTNFNNLQIFGNNSGILIPVNFEGPSLDADPGVGIQTITQQGGCCETIAIIKLDFSGNHLWSLEMGNNSGLEIDHLVSDSSGAIYAQGDYWNTLDFDPGPGTDIVTSGIGQETFILKLNQDGTYAWSKQFGSSGPRLNNGIELGSEGVYAFMTLRNTGNWNIDGESITGNGSWDSFISKWDFDGNYQWSRTLATSEYDYGYGFSVNPTCDAVYVLGEVYPLTPATIPFDQFGSDDRVVPDTGAFYTSRYSTLGEYTWTSVVDTATDFFYVTNTAIGTGDSIFISGEVEGAAIDFDDTGGSDIVNTGGNTTAFISKLSSTQYKQHLINLSTTINAQEQSTGDSARLGEAGVARNPTTTIRIPDADNNAVIADVNADLSCDRDWTGVTGDSGTDSSFISGLTAAEGTAATLDLYIPLTSSVGVGVCPGATSLGALTSGCAGYYELLDGDAGLTQATIGSDDYWQVLGIADSGAFNLTSSGGSPPETTPDPESEPESELAETGNIALFSLLFGASMFGTVAIIEWKHRHPILRPYGRH